MDNKLFTERQELLYELCQIINSDNENSEAINLLNKLTNNEITLEDCKYELDKLSSKSSYWNGKNLPKNLYDNIKLYKKGKLNKIQTAKMISSIITRSLIEIEHNDINSSNLKISELNEILNGFLVNENIDITRLNDILEELGLINSEEVN